MSEGAAEPAARGVALQTRGTVERVISFLAYFYGVTGVLLLAALLLKVVLLAGSSSFSLGREKAASLALSSALDRFLTG